MSEPPSDKLDPSFVDAAIEEHRGCMERVTEVEACLDRHPDDRDRWVADLGKRLRLLDHTLRAHFVAEEAGPLFRQLPLRHPRLANRLTELEQEHGRMLEQIGAVREHASTLKGSELHELRTFNAEVQLLVARIRRHEAAENELLLEANWVEVGVGD